MDYKITKISKGNGRHRNIYITSKHDRNILKSFLPTLESILLSLDNNNANYAFQKGKNCVLNAYQHIGYRYTLTMDLENFFDSVNREHVEGILSQGIINKCFIEGAPRQGLPTSPLIATIAFLKSDSQILAILKNFDLDTVYTRYADDLAFSFNDISILEKLTLLVTQVVESNGFKINKRKTSIQNIKNGRIILTGLGIDDKGIHPTRKTKKKIRAALHQKNHMSAQGLIEWSKCKIPNQLKS